MLVNETVEEKQLPYNLLFEVFILGMNALASGMLSSDSKKIADIASKELDELAKNFGYSGLEEFDKSDEFFNKEETNGN